MPEITLETVNQEPQEETDAVMQNDAAPAIAEEEPVEEVSEKDLSEKEDVVEQTPVVKKARGRPTGPPKPKPEAKKRGRPPTGSKPAPSYEAPVAWDMDAYNRSLINALVQHSQSSKSHRRAQWSSLVKL